jgi:hypothetical protein
MKSLIIAFSILLIIFILSNYDIIESFVTKKEVCNNVDYNCYPIVTKYEERQRASEILGELNLFAIKLMRHLRNKYIWNYSNNIRARDITIFLLSNYNPNGIIENDPSSDVNTSYVDDKGRVLAMCLREKVSGKNYFHSMHLLQFVIMHEMAHMATISIGHESDFWSNFRFLLKEAQEAGLYTSIDYNKNPVNYCSLKVTYNPYFDNTLDEFY